VKFIEVNGDSIILGGDKEKAFQDVLSTVDPKYHDRITTNENGLININKDGLTIQKITGEVDAGLGTLIGLSESSNYYVYEVSETWVKYDVSGDVTTELSNRYPDNSRSIYGYIGNKILENLGTENIGGREVPIFGRLTIHPSMQIFNKNGYPLPRSTLVYHGLEELYQRVDFRKSKPGSHRISIEKANRNFHLGFKFPYKIGGFRF